MDLRILHGRSAMQEALLSRRFDAEREGRILEFYRGREDGIIATDVFARAFGSAGAKNSYREFDPRGESEFKWNRPEYASLADIYEGALRKVLSIQLNLKIDEQQPYNQDGNDVIREKVSPPRPKALRLEDLKQSEEYRYRRRALDEESEPRVPPRGLTNLRKLGDRNSEGSAFHVPPKRRFDGPGFPPLEREASFHMERLGMVPSHFQSHLPPGFSARMDAARSSRLAPLGYVPSRSTTQETYSQYSSHHREIPPLFPVRCTSRDRDSILLQRKHEYESKERKTPDNRRTPDVAQKSPDLKTKIPDNKRRSPDILHKSPERRRPNGFNEKSLWNRNEGKTPIKVEREDSTFEKINFEEKFNKANEQITNMTSFRAGPLSRPSERKSPLSLRFRPYSLRTKNSHGLTMNGKLPDSQCPNSLIKAGIEMGIKQENRKVPTVQEGEKEEFLSNLGLARISK